MRRPRHLPIWLMAVVVAAAMGLWLWWSSRSDEPRFEGRPDSEVVLVACKSWVTTGKFDYLPLDALGAERSVAAIIRLYQNYRPSLRAQWGDTAFSWWMLRFAGDWPRLNRLIQESMLFAHTELSTEAVRQLAVPALEHFGQAAAPAVPLLVDRITSEGPAAAAVRALGAVGAKAAPALPCLQQVAATNDLWFLHTVGVSLRQIRPGSEIAILPSCLTGMASTNERVRAKAVELLAFVGPPAAEALPRLRELRSDSWKMVRDAAETALTAIGRTNSPPAAAPPPSH